MGDATQRVAQLVERHLDSREKQLGALRAEAERLSARLKSLVDKMGDDVTVNIDVRHNEPFTVSTPPARQRAHPVSQHGALRHAWDVRLSLAEPGHLWPNQETRRRRQIQNALVAKCRTDRALHARWQCGHARRRSGSLRRRWPHDCGACGGRRGGPNARLFAAMANRDEVRDRLRERGLDIPADTWFVGGYHDTCSDGVEFFDLDALPATHQTDRV